MYDKIILSCLCNRVVQLLQIIQKKMANINKDIYINKLVKVVQQKENQIEGLKQKLRNATNKLRTDGAHDSESKNPLEETIKHELYLTSTQLKEVTQQMYTMENKMVELQEGLQEEIVKNNELQTQIKALKEQNIRIKIQNSSFQQAIRYLEQDKNSYAETILKNKIEFQEISQQLRSLFQSFDSLKNSQEFLRSEKDSLIMEIKQIRQRQVKEGLHRLELEKQISYFKVELLQKQNKYQLIQAEIKQKAQQIQQKDIQIEQKRQQIEGLHHQINQLRLSHRKIEAQLQTKSSQLQLKHRQNHHLGQSLKDYEQFSFQISKYIESAFLKHCCQGHLRSSKKIIRQTQRAQTMFESSFKKMTQIQNLMDEFAEKLQKIKQDEVIPEQSLDNISMIARSFVQKLELCDLTERLQRENEQLIRNQEEVIKNLEKDCQSSFQRERSHIVELGQMKQVLKMTKEVNRQLLEQVNQRDCIISECKRLYQKCLPRNCQEYHLMKQTLEQI